MIAVIDASGAMTMLLHSKKAEAYEDVFQKSSLILAPDLYVSELTNAFWKYYKAKILTTDECLEFIRDGIAYVSKFIDCKEIWQEAFSEGVKNNHSIYDMLYMVTARRNNGVLITNDSTLADICKKNHVQICH
ncbi:MAG: type II toxin-antitoxin system VapC family toxin [Spirochaetes bacterium]|nr:type II toxin-antitoxin system VapC family toxin [Spirochaetota bacterium]